MKLNADLRDLTDAPEFNGIYRTYFVEPFPARTTVRAGESGFLVEVEALAATNSRS